MPYGGPSGAKGGVGRLRHRVTLRSPVRTKGATGQQKLTGWTPQGTYWASVTEIAAAGGGPGQEQTQADRQVPEATHLVEIRGGPAVLHDWSILWGSRQLNVLRVTGGGSGIANPLVIFAKEVPASTA